MTLQEIRQKNRQMLDDSTKVDSKRYWPNAELNEYINTVIEEFAEQTLCLTDSLTDSVCLITLVANQRHYTISDAILHIQTAQPSWQTQPLDKQSVVTINTGWLTDIGLPHSYLLDYNTNRLSLTSAPATVSGETIRLTVNRLPLADIAADDDTPEIPRQYHRQLTDGVLALAYSKQDSEVYNPSKAKSHRAAWDDILALAKSHLARLKPRIIVARRTEMM